MGFPRTFIDGSAVVTWGFFARVFWGSDVGVAVLRQVAGKRAAGGIVLAYSLGNWGVFFIGNWAFLHQEIGLIIHLGAACGLEEDPVDAFPIYRHGPPSARLGIILTDGHSTFSGTATRHSTIPTNTSIEVGISDATWWEWWSRAGRSR